MTQPRPGWYPDPSDPSHQRYFDGKAWTEKYAPFGAPTLPVDAPTKPGMSRGLKIGLGVGAAALAFIAIGAIGNSEKKSNSSSSTTVTVTRTVASAPPTAAPEPTNVGPATTLDGDGTFLVGKDIVPGQYRSAGGSGGRSDCYWQRQSALGGGNDAILASDLAEGQQVVEILPTDVAFQSKHCQPWEKIE